MGRIVVNVSSRSLDSTAVSEAVGTRPEYLGRGLVKKLFLQMIHPATEARGDAIQLIAGIPHSIGTAKRIVFLLCVSYSVLL